MLSPISSGRHHDLLNDPHFLLSLYQNRPENVEVAASVPFLVSDFENAALLE